MRELTKDNTQLEHMFLILQKEIWHAIVNIVISECMMLEYFLHNRINCLLTTFVVECGRKCDISVNQAIIVRITSKSFQDGRHLSLTNQLL